MPKEEPSHTAPALEEKHVRIRRENVAKPQFAPRSMETHDAARDLWTAGWNHSRVATAPGIPRRETAIDWARAENWFGIQRD